MLGTAVLMLILGETVLRGSLPPAGFLLYYTFCLVLTATAILIALADARTSAQRTVQEQRELLNSTIKNLQREIQTGDPKKQAGDSQRIDPNRL